MKCNKCGYDWTNSGDSAHVCGPVKVKQQRTFVGLTDDEFNEICLKNHPLNGLKTFVQAIENKLAEKNI